VEGKERQAGLVRDVHKNIKEKCLTGSFFNYKKYNVFKRTLIYYFRFILIKKV